MSSLFLALALFASGCGDDSSEAATGGATSGGATAAVPLLPLFPVHPGDRWRLESTDGTFRIEGVTGVDAAGIAAVHGTGHIQAERYRQTRTEVTLVTPDGRPLSPILRAPIRTGARFEYEHTERDVAIPCDVEIVSTTADMTVAGTEAVGCVELRRRCRYPAGTPFPTETTHTSEETYCPGIGLVVSRSTFRPPPTRSAIPSEREERVVGFRVDSGPAPSLGGCARYILMPNDVAAACGPDVVADASAQGGTGEAAASGACRYRYRHGTASLEVIVGGDAAARPDDALMHVAADGRAAWLLGPATACSGPGRLEPLLSSLLR